VIEKRTILIVDDHPLFREGLKAILARKAMCEVVGEAGGGREALGMARELKPDLVLLDLALPDQSGIELTREIHNLLPETRIMIVSMHSKVDYIVGAFRAGATGYLVKDSATESLLHGIDAVFKGEYFMDGSVSNEVVKKLMGFPEKKRRIGDPAYETLTPRQQEIMVLLAEGSSSKQIAEKLFISPKTAENHRGAIMNRLGLKRHHELVRYAARLGLIDVDLWKQ